MREFHLYIVVECEPRIYSFLTKEDRKEWLYEYALLSFNVDNYIDVIFDGKILNTSLKREDK